MPIEVELLKDKDHPSICPCCGLDFLPFMRGQRVRGFLWLFTWPGKYKWALICDSCREIIGYDSVDYGYILIVKDTFKICPECHGKGWEEKHYSIGEFGDLYQEPCSWCGGVGKVINKF